ncbi:hypothetical protein AB6A40_007730 [Gnathostoma spinigerum]|uniref:receptor protein-tyrosine kinase n=1 Tax=Gnathostoma spinigerum TaxID=75299 RepID=A0ABD6EMK9_9BILA
MLCYNKIKALIDHIGLTDVEDNDVSYYSNGDRAICNETKFDVHTEDVHSFGFMISWTAFNTTDMDHRKFLGYQVFFKKVDGPNPNLSIYDDRSACSDSWSMHFEPEKGNAREGLNRGTGLFGLDSNTWYAYYVQTKLINHPGARNAISVIHFVKTLFSPPDPPRDVRGESNKPDEIELEWEPPERPNGDITHYIVKWQWLPDDLSIMSGHVCDDKAGAGRRQQKETSGMRHHVTVAPSTAELGTCSKQAGCCECNTMKKSQSEIDISAEEAEKTGEAAFENAVQNLVFVQHDVNKNMAASKRVRRAPLPSPEVTNIGSDLHVVNNDRAIIVTQNEVNETTSFYEVKNMTQTHKVNVTTLRLRIAGLRHYTQYQIWVHACQNVSAVGGAYCSQRPGWMVSRTLPIPENDLVDNSTIRTVNTTGVANHRSRKLFWKEPESPNGAVLAYKVKVISEGMTPIPVCVKASKFRNDGGVTFNGLPEGEYRVEIRTISMASYAAVSADEVVVAYAVFRIITPSLFTWKTIALIFSCIFLVLLIASLLALRFCRPIVGKRWQQYIHQQITANPEYFSQMDVYKPDEWELNRDDIHLEEEIGRGTFGKVYRGYADNILSQCGKRFGDCAVKTVAEGTNSTERIHFLFEASVMKQFNTSFIVKLYGVVSDGQPVLVVMELMEKGNLRDYLRSRRPDSEENIDHLPVPTNAEYVRWAAQIADGMAYLESLKFCHRDLAARNCMVNQRDNVKIGDFGMARDLYYHEYYKPTGTRLMAVRWMAPESLRDGKFTMKSDVWSYGIVLYEMLTLAQQPYTGIGTEAVFQYIGVSRRILARPTGCPDFWYDLMVKCWKFDPRERPDFAEIVADLIPYTEKEFIEESFVVNDCTKIKSDVDTVDETMHLDELCLTSISDNGKLCMDIAPIDEIDKKPVCNWNRRNASTSLTSARRPGNLLNAVNGPANELRPTHLASAEDDDL